MKFWKLWSVVFVVVVSFTDLSNSKDNKRSPCPEVFIYRKGVDGIFGRVTVPIDQIGNENGLQLNISLAHNFPLPTTYQGYIQANYHISDILTSVPSKTKTLTYNVIFPTRDEYFYILSVHFNGKLLCYRNIQPYMGNMYINLSDYKIIRDNGPAPSTVSQTTKSTQYVYPEIRSDRFIITHKKKTCASSFLAEECPTTDSNMLVAYTYKTTTLRTTPVPKIKATRQYTSTTQTYRPSSTTTTEEPARANPDNFVKTVKQDPNVNYNSRFDSAQLDMICGIAKVDSLRKWPWATAVYQKGQTKLTVVSSGALLSDIFVITAAAKISKFNGRPTRPSELSVRVGAFDLEDWLDKSSSPRTPLEIIYHPGFNPAALVTQNNIALLRITPLTFNKFISPVCLIRENRPNIDKMVDGMTIGWGYDVNDMINVRSSEIAMRTLPEDECRRANVLIPSLMTPTTLCARSEPAPQICSEEPGQGFYTPRGNSANKWIIAGVLSHSIKNNPTICKVAETRLFTDLSKHAVWIEEQMYRQNY